MTTTLQLPLSIITGLILLSGCAGTPQQEDNALNSHASFMDAWNTYTHCLSTKEPEAIVSDLRTLNQFADKISKKTHARPFGVLPYSLPPLPSRLAVNPADMVSACAKHGAEVALSLDKPSGSADLLITAVEAQKHLNNATD